MKREMVMLGNLNCPTCAADLEKALKKMDGIKEATVTFATGALDLVYDENVVKTEQIDRTVTGFGVTVTARM